MKTGMGFFLFLAAFCFLTSSCSRGSGKELPSEIMGRWTTDSPRYKDASMEIEKDFIVFRNGDYTIRHRITAFEVEEKGDGPVNRIFYEEPEGGESSLSFFIRHMEDGGGRKVFIVYKNQALVWEKADSRVLDAPTGSPR